MFFITNKNFNNNRDEIDKVFISLGVSRFTFKKDYKRTSERNDK